MDLRNVNDATLLSLCRHDSEDAFKMIYNRYVNRLYRYLLSRVLTREISQEIIHDVFIHVWTNRKTLRIESLPSFLFAAARNRMLNHLRHVRIERKYANELEALMKDAVDNSNEENAQMNDLEAFISKTIETLPARVREVYCRSRMHYQSIDEIANSMNISSRTVENYITLSLKHLKEHLDVATSN